MLTNNNKKQSMDPIYSEFLPENFDQQNAIASVNNLPFSEQISKIAAGIEQLKNNINQLTTKNCETFFRRASKLDELYNDLRFIGIKSQNLMKTMELMIMKFESPYQQLNHEIILLSRLQKTCDLLRKMLRIMYLMERIDESNMNNDMTKNESGIFLKEIIKLSQYVNEIDGIIQSDEENLLHKLNCISKDLEKFQQIKSKIIIEADSLLRNGLESLDNNNIGAALQIYHNLRSLDSIVNDLIVEKCRLIEQSLSKLFDDMNMNEMKLTIPSSTRQNNLMKTSIRSNCKCNLENLYIHFHQISTMIKILKKRRDNQTQTLLIEFIDNRDELIRKFWNEIIRIFSASFNKLFHWSPAIKRLIESDYSKILSFFLDYSERIIVDEPEIENEITLRSTIGQFENAYLSNSLSSLFESVNRIFTNVGVIKNQKIDSIPSEKDVDLVIKDISNEIVASNFDSMLLESVCRNIVKTINLFVFKCEQLVSNDGDATQVIGKFTINQRHNSLIIYSLNYFHKQLKNLIINNDKNQSILKKHLIETSSSLKSIDNLILNTFEPFIKSIQDAIEDIILTIHNEKYDINSKIMPSNCSLYMKELQRFIARISRDYFQQYPNDAEIIKERIHQMAAFVIDFFLLQNCLIRPVSAMGRQKIFNDFTQLEEAIIPICDRLGDVGRSFQILKAFKTLLLLSPEELCDAPIVGDPIPYYLVIYFFIANHTTDELKSPHKFKDWSISRYSQWFMAENRNDEERLSIIRNSLNEYIIQAKKSQKKQYFATYHLLSSLMKKTNVE
ncbi:conserved oligomeric Golgi complex subunit 5 four way stop isoform X2 [Dermatophagoides farinae]|uniref:Conserved oligomeric Golgi complex subunit 5 n=2 Tax=Dermatophagoides farinae TaxID=6954 RepID=A0A922I756_DERFA|nr:conserved oligomeric Golgi complex subunit 5-like [Dermatophagoides farinae]KAH9521961.1 Conserved oligomeric Golgi complex subunit [Dermatophagoides farinae]